MWHDLDDDSPGRHPYVTTAEARAVVRDEHVGLQEQVDLRERWQALQDHLLEDRSSSSRQALQISDYLLHVLDASDRPSDVDSAVALRCTNTICNSLWVRGRA